VIDFTNILKEDLSCYDAILELAAEHYETNIQPHYINCFNFYYQKNKNPFQMVLCRKKNEDNDLLKKLSGLTIKTIYRDKYNSFVLDKIRSFIVNNGIVGIYIDSFHLPWNPLFKLHHQNHYLLVVQRNKQIFCLDPYLSNRPICIEEVKHTLIQHYIKVLFFKFDSSDIASQTYNSIKNLLKSSVDFEHNHYTDLINFAEDFKFQLDHVEECTDIAIATSPLLKNITRVVRDRKNYKRCLDYYNELWDESFLFRECNRLERLCQNWASCQRKYLKYLLLRDERMLDDIYMRLLCLAEQENVIRKELMEL